MVFPRTQLRLDTESKKGTVKALIDVLERERRVSIIAPRMTKPDGSVCRNSQRYLTVPRMIAASSGLSAPLGLRQSRRRHSKSHEASM